MFRPELILTDTPEITLIPTFIFLKIRDLLEKRKIEYEVIPYYHLPEGCPCKCIYRGKEYTTRTYGVKTCVNKENLFDIAEQLYHIAPDDVQ